MSNLDALYQELILEHNRRPRNYRVMEGADRVVEGHNPLCGDALTLWLKMDGDRVSDASFQGSGCAISRASASLMTEAVKGKTRAEADALFERFHDLVTGKLNLGVNLRHAFPHGFDIEAGMGVHASGRSGEDADYQRAVRVGLRYNFGF